MKEGEDQECRSSNQEQEVKKPDELGLDEGEVAGPDRDMFAMGLGQKQERSEPMLEWEEESSYS